MYIYILCIYIIFIYTYNGGRGEALLFQLDPMEHKPAQAVHDAKANVWS